MHQATGHDNHEHNHHIHHDTGDDNDMARYHIINDHNIQPCNDDDCIRHHVHVFSEHDLAARDNANYDAGHRAANTHHADHAANTGYAAIDAYLAGNRDRLVATGTAGNGVPRGRIRDRKDLSETLTWARWEDEFAPQERKGIDVTCAVVWTSLLLTGLAFWTAVSTFAWRLVN